MIEIIRALDLKSTPWKNGQGLTTQIAIEPASADVSSCDFDWRVSLAEIRASGSFSTFAGFDRILTVLGPDAVRLNDTELRIMRPFRFRGDDATHATLIGDEGVTRDLGLIFRRDHFRADVAVHELAAGAAQTLVVKEHGVVFLVEGRVDVQDATIEGGDSVRFSKNLQIQNLAGRPSKIILLSIERLK